MYEQGVFKGELTLLQKYALSITLASIDQRIFEKDFSLVKALQLVINPSMYNQLYGAEEQEALEEAGLDESMYDIDLSNPEDIDDYLERLYTQQEHTSTSFVGSNQIIEVGV